MQTNEQFQKWPPCAALTLYCSWLYVYLHLQTNSQVHIYKWCDSHRLYSDTKGYTPRNPVQQGSPYSREPDDNEYHIYNQHGIRVKGRLPSMLKATMKDAAGTSVVNMETWSLSEWVSELQIRVLLEVGCAGLKN